MPRVSIVVVNYNGGALLRDCLASIAAQTYRDFEVIVVDNGSEDDSLAAAATVLSGARVVALGENTGFARGNNVGIAASAGDLVVTLNNDATLAPSFLAELVAAADRLPSAGMFAPKTLISTEPGRIDSAGLLIYLDGVYRPRGWQETDGPAYQREEEVVFPCASAALYRRAMLDDVGLFDEEYFLYLEDADLGMRGPLAGLALLVRAARRRVPPEELDRGQALEGQGVPRRAEPDLQPGEARAAADHRREPARDRVPLRAASLRRDLRSAAHPAASCATIRTASCWRSSSEATPVRCARCPRCGASGA